MKFISKIKGVITNIEDEIVCITLQIPERIEKSSNNISNAIDSLLPGPRYGDLKINLPLCILPEELRCLFLPIWIELDKKIKF